MNRSFFNCAVRVVAAALLLRGFGGRVLAVDAKPLFLAQCASCHGVDGKAKTPIGRKIGVKDLTVSQTTDAEIEKQLLEGKKDSVPIDLLIYDNNSLQAGMQRRIEEEDPYFQMIHRQWGDGLRSLFAQLPNPP